MPGHPSFVRTSLWQTPQACTLIRTCPASGLGISRSTISKSAPGLETCAAFIFVIFIGTTLLVAIKVSYKFLTTLLIIDFAGFDRSMQIRFLNSAFGFKFLDPWIREMCG